jgi:hypothetical protein
VSKFDEYFSEPQSFNNGMLVISADIDPVDAALMISSEVGEIVNPEDLEPERVRFGFAPEWVEDYQDLGACWYTGASGKGSKAVWVYET